MSRPHPEVAVGDMVLFQHGRELEWQGAVVVEVRDKVAHDIPYIPTRYRYGMDVIVVVVQHSSGMRPRLFTPTQRVLQARPELGLTPRGWRLL